MRNEKFFTYVEKHPVARFIDGPISTILAIYGFFSLIVVVSRFTGEMYTIGCNFSFALIIFGGVILPIGMTFCMPSKYRGELITDYFIFFYSASPGKIKYEVEVNGNMLKPVNISRKNAPHSVRQHTGMAGPLVFNLPDKNNIYVISGGDKMMIFLNDTIIMEDDHIYYDRIDQIYGATNNPSIAQSVQQPGNAAPSVPVNESIGRTAPITGLQSGNSYTLTALEGQFAGKNWNFDKAVMLGRDGNCCQITFSADTAGVSRVHCEVGYKEGSLYIRDLGSSYGTVLENGSIVNNYQEVKVENNTVFRLNNNEKFRLTK